MSRYTPIDWYWDGDWSIHIGESTPDGGFGAPFIRRSTEDLLAVALGVHLGDGDDPLYDWEDGATPFRPAIRPVLEEWGPPDHPKVDWHSLDGILDEPDKTKPKYKPVVPHSHVPRPEPYVQTPLPRTEVEPIDLDATLVDINGQKVWVKFEAAKRGVTIRIDDLPYWVENPNFEAEVVTNPGLHSRWVQWNPQPWRKPAPAPTVQLRRLTALPRILERQGQSNGRADT